jgi:vacuolar-type H+-ATPase subunit H
LKFDLNEDELTKIVEIIIGLNMKILNSIFNNIEVHIPKLSSVWYKCLKKTAKFYYEYPNMITSNTYFEEQQHKINEIIKDIIQKFIPMKSIIESVKNNKNTSINDYINDFDDDDNTSDKRSNKTRKSKNKSSDKQSDNESDEVYKNSDEELSKLEVVREEDSQSNNDYYTSNNNKQVLEVSEEKHIHLPKYSNKKHNNFHINKPAKNEIDENFFDEF